VSVSHSQLLGLGAILSGFILVIADIPLLSSVGAYSYLLVVLLAILAVAVGGLDLVDRRMAHGDWWHPSHTESGYQVLVPGDEFADLRESELKERLRHRVIGSLMDELDCSKADAKAHLEDGTWTDDRLAAAYLGPQRIRMPLRTWLLGKIRRNPIEERAIRHTVIALRELRGGGS